MDGSERLGPYRILRELGAGGMGHVSLAEREGLEGPVVIKRMNAELAANPRFRRRLLREAEVAAGLQHPNVVRVLDTGVTDDQLYLVMEYVPGSSLAGVLAASRPEPLPLVPALHALAQACDGLAYVHRFAEPRTGRWMELVHRDVSLDNLLVSYSGEVKVADFGIVKTADGTQTTSGVIMGKLGYMSPEQIRDEPLDARSDVYSLGVCCFELLAGRRPLPAHRKRSVMEAVLYDEPPPLEQARQDVPPALAALMARMLAKERADRPASCDEVAKELRALLAGREEPTLFPSRLLEARPRNRTPLRPAEGVTELEALAPTRPQRLLAPEPVATPEPRPARKLTPSPGVRRPTPVPGVSMPEETLALGPEARRPTPAPGPATRGETLALGLEARRPTPVPAPASRRQTPAPVSDSRPTRESASESEPLPGSRPSRPPNSEQDASLASQSTRLLAAPASRHRQLRWAVLGGLVLFGAAACWWWS